MRNRTENLTLKSNHIDFEKQILKEAIARRVGCHTSQVDVFLFYLVLLESFLLKAFYFQEVKKRINPIISMRRHVYYHSCNYAF